jgi:outer membrane protein assembly factor BamB
LDNSALNHDSQLVANPSGGVLASVGNSSTASQPDVQQVMADGSLGWTRDHVEGRALFPIPVFDGRSNAYWSEQQDGATTIIARSESGTAPWETPMPSGWVTGEIAVGVNGDVYVLGKIATQGSAALKRLDAADGRVISTTPLPSTLFPGSQLFAYSAGLIIAGADVKYLDNDGNLAHRYDLPNGSVPIFSANADGGLFAGTFPQGPGGMCGLGDGSLSISKYTPTDGQVWNHLGQSTRRCNGYLQLTALPNGGVVGTFGTDGIESKELTALSSTTGDVLWTQTPHPPSSLNGSIQAAVQLKVDIKGQIAVSESFRFTCRNGAEICEGTQIEFRSGDSGEIFHPTAEFYKGDPDPNLYTSAGFNHLAIADGRAYLALHHSNGTPLTSTATDYPLVALDAPALGGSYPESTLIDLPPTPHDADLTIKDVKIFASPSDRMLNRVIRFEPNDPSVKIARFEYAWGTDIVLTRARLDSKVCRFNLPLPSVLRADRT